MSARKITIHGFLNEFKRRHEQMKDRPFCWVLGSGASIQSGIPTGGALVSQWLTELHELEDFDGVSLEQWATPENLGIPGFELAHAASFYPWIYQRRFRDYKEQGYAFLETAMDHAEPSFGYSVLAQLMAITPHKVAVTTNFDNLIADALSIYTRTFPLVCGHESLTGYIRANLRRPLVAKIHRDLLLAPLSNPDEIAKLPSEWATALTKIFDRFTEKVRKDYDEAERLYRKALDLDSNEAISVGNFAAFMSDVRKDYDEADRLYRKALELDPTNQLLSEKYEAFRNAHLS